MIAGIAGKIVSSTGQTVLIRVGPVTISASMPVVQLATLRPGAEVELHTYLHFSSSADQLKLFAFTSAIARDLFITLISGPGVGPKVALALLELGVPGLVGAIRDTDEKALTSVTGVGPKMAKKICLELTDKIARDFSGVTEGSTRAEARSSSVDDALDAVASLGFSRLQAEQALQTIGGDIGAEDTTRIIKILLSQLSQQAK